MEVIGIYDATIVKFHVSQTEFKKNVQGTEQYKTLNYGDYPICVLRIYIFIQYHCMFYSILYYINNCEKWKYLKKSFLPNK